MCASINNSVGGPYLQFIRKKGLKSICQKWEKEEKQPRLFSWVILQSRIKKRLEKIRCRKLSSFFASFFTWASKCRGVVEGTLGHTQKPKKRKKEKKNKEFAL
jgi:hypothetical protein